MDNMKTQNGAEHSGTPVKRRDRKEIVKNLIIVFLLIMLLLTFFSNTIMNYSLPEVSVTRMSRSNVSKSYGLSISVEANKTYMVEAEEAREIKRVAVKKGQEVKEGQVLFYLKEMSESEEAEALNEQIDAAKLAYEKAIMTVSEDYYEYNLAISQARDALNAIINEKNSAADRPVPEDNSGRIASLSQKISSLKKELEEINAGNYKAMNADRYSAVSPLADAFYKADEEYTAAQKLYDQHSGQFTSGGGDAGIQTMERSLATLKTELARLKEDNAPARTIEDKQTAVNYMTEDLTALKNIKQLAETAKADADVKKKTRDDADAALKAKISETTAAVNTELSSAESQLAAIGVGEETPEDMPPVSKDYDSLIRDAQYALDTAVHNLEVKMEADRVSNAQEQLDLAAQKKSIDDLEADLAELVSAQKTTEILSPVDGVVETINVSAGQAFLQNDELMMINISDDGFTATASVTSEQAKSIKKGTEARITDYTDDAAVVVKSISKDKNDASKFSVVFTVTGDVVAGQTIAIELGEQASTYDKVIPRSAVKKDSSGSFVYAVRSKNTPLGNRYIVEKVAVTVVAEDDTKCAVNGDFGDSADYIITASSKPFTAGDQVRFSQE